jgi:hypothetical protein
MRSNRGIAADSAYARLLAAHVRPGTIGGTALNLIDYAAVKSDPSYAQALGVLAAARPEALGNASDRFAFWANAYNLLAIKAVIDHYPVASIKDGGSLLRPIWKQPIGEVAGKPYALDDVENGILRREFHEPRVHFAIVCASVSCPDLRAEPYDGSRLEAQLDDQARRFLANPRKGLLPGADGNTAQVSSIFKWFRDDFAQTGGVAAFIRAHADPAEQNKIFDLTDDGLSYLAYDWSLNDLARDEHGAAPASRPGATPHSPG